MSSKKKRSFVEKQPKAGAQELQPDSDFTIVYSALKDTLLDSTEKPSVWRLATLLGQFEIQKLSINKKEYNQFRKQESSSNVAAIFMCKNDASVEIRLACRGDGGWHSSTFFFEVLINEKTLFTKAKRFPAQISGNEAGGEFTPFIRSIDGDPIDEPLLAHALQKILPRWSDMVEGVLESKLKKYQEMEDMTDQDQVDCAALEAFYNVFRFCLKNELGN